jgi:hypothetical protein
MKTILTLACLCCLFHTAAASAQSLEGLPAFGYSGIANLRQYQAEAAVAPVHGKATDVITATHLMLQGGKDVLFGYADNDAQFNEAAAYWTPVLKAAGITLGTPTYEEGGMYKIPYTATGGRVVRSFLADSQQFPPKDEAGLRSNMALAQDAMAKAGLSLISARVVNIDGGLILPTYSLLYLTKADDVAEHEVLLRVLKPGDDIDFSVFSAAGVNIIQTPQTWMMVYIGPEVGFVSMAAHDQDEAAKKLQARKDFLLQNGKRMIAERVLPLDDADYKFLVNLYFYQ